MILKKKSFNFFTTVQRYGWHGHTDGLLQENIDAALGKYPWLAEARECSVTELELRHAHLNHPGNMPAVICFRDKVSGCKVAEVEEK